LKEVPENGMKISLKGIYWQYLSQKGLAWLESVNHDPPTGMPVKASYNRHVLRLAGNFYIKEVRYRGIRSLLKMPGGGNACKEGEKNLELARRGINVPKVVAFGCEASRGVIRRDLLISEEVVNGETLDTFIRNEFLFLDFQSKKLLIFDLASFMKNLHDKGIFHTDLHIGNIFITREGGKNRFFLLDLDRVQLKSKELSRIERARNLALLLSNFWMLSSLGQRFRFLKYYGVNLHCPQDRNFIKLIMQTALAHSEKVWKSKARRCLFNNSRFIKERSGPFWVHRVRRPDVEQILHEMLPDPDLILAKGEVIKNGRTVKAVKVEFEGRLFFLKRYNCKGWGYRFRNAFRRSRAVRTWHATWGFLVRSLPVPKPLICLEERNFRLLERSYILSEFMENTNRISAVWPELDDWAKRSLYIKSAMLFGRMHQIGAFHGDLKWSNILIRPDQNADRLILCDMDAAKVYRKTKFKRSQKDLNRFIRDMKCFDKDGGNRAFFYHIWQKWSGCPD